MKSTVRTWNAVFHYSFCYSESGKPMEGQEVFILQGKEIQLMRKMMKKTVMLVLVLVLAMPWTTVTAAQYSDLTGDWLLEYSFGGAQIAQQSVIMNENNTFEVTDEDGSSMGNWSYDGETLVLSKDGEDLALTWDAQTQQLTGDYSGMKITMSMFADPQNGAGAAEESGTDMLTGGWEIAEDPTITNELNNQLQLALDDYQTGTITIAYTPVTYLGSQVVAGTNHAILCRASEINKGSKWVIIYIYEDLEGNASVIDVADFDFGALCTY